MVAFRDFTGGFNDTVSMDSLKENELLVGQNISVFKGGGATVRHGSEPLNAVSYAGNITQIIEWPLSSGGYKYLAMMGKKLYLMNDVGGALTEKITLNADMIGSVVYKDRLFFVDGNDYYVYGDYGLSSLSGVKDVALNAIVKNFGSTGGGTADHFYKALAIYSAIDLGVENYADATKWVDVTDGTIPDDIRPVVVDSAVEGADLTNIKKCTILEFHQPSLRIFASGNPKSGTAVYFSESDNPYAFKGSSELYPTSALGPVTGLQPFMSMMLASYKTGWRVWSGTEVGLDAAWKPVPIPTGCLNQWAKTLTPDSLTFWGNDGLYVVYPSILSDDMAMVVSSNRFKRLDVDKVENTVKLSKDDTSVRVLYFDGQVYFSFKSGDESTANDRVLLMDWERKTFTLNTGWLVNSMIVAKGTGLRFSSHNYILKIGEGKNDWDVLTGAEKPIESIIELRPLSLGEFAHAFYQKYFKSLYISASEQLSEEIESKITVKVVSDYVHVEGGIESETEVLTELEESLIWGRTWILNWGFNDNIIKVLHVDKAAFRFRIRIESNYINNDWFIHAFGCEYQLRDGSKANEIDSGALSHIVD
jgi:hypothetical protein